MIAPKHPDLPPGVHWGRVCCLPRPRGCAWVSSCSALSRTLPFYSAAATVPLGAGKRGGPAPEIGGSGQALMLSVRPCLAHCSQVNNSAGQMAEEHMQVRGSRWGRRGLHDESCYHWLRLLICCFLERKKMALARWWWLFVAVTT